MTTSPACLCPRECGIDTRRNPGTIHILPYQFWASPQIRDASELKGKRAAISTFGSGSHLALEVALHTLGLDPARDNIAILQVGTQPERVTALVTGKIDATVLEPGFGQAAKDKGLKMLVDLTRADVPYLNTVLVASRRVPEGSPDRARRDARRFLRSRRRSGSRPSKRKPTGSQAALRRR